MEEKFDYKTGTHCWYCDREFTGIYPLARTKDHVVPRHVIKANGATNNIENYIAACGDCNKLKAHRMPDGFARYLIWLIHTQDCSGYPTYNRFDMIIFRAWKIHNKRSKLIKEILNAKPMYVEANSIIKKGIKTCKAGSRS